MRISGSRILLAGMFAGAGLVVGCGCSSLPGTYSDPNGAMTLEIKSGGSANLSFMGQTAACTYAVSGQKLSLDCKGDAGKITLTIRDDGSLAGPADSLFPPLQKRK